MSASETAVAENPAGGDTPLVSVSGLVKTYPGVIALRGVHMDINRGSLLGLVGKNGAGKSTLIKVLGGVVSPDEGEIRFDGHHQDIHNPHQALGLGIAVVHQELADVPNLSVAENVELGLGFPKIGGVIVNKRALRNKTREALATLGADISPAATTGSLSVAQRRLVMIARGLAADARVLILDEPTAALADAEIEHLHTVLRGLRDRGVAIVYVTHRLDEVFELTDQVTVMRDGAVVHEAPTSEMTRGSLIRHITGHSQHGDKPRERRITTPPADADELLRVEGMTLPGIVEDAGFTLRRGELLGIAGLVGAGRTELMRMIYGADRAAGGVVHVNGERVDVKGPRDALKAGIVLLPEDRREQGNVVDFSVRKNVTLPRLKHFRSRGLPIPSRAKEREYARSAIERLNIKVAHEENPVRHLSGGNQQKVMLAKWLDSGAEIFIFDEPTHGIDVDGKEETYKLMEELALAGKGVIFISSEFVELVGACNRVIVMREGRLVGELEGEEITDAALVERCFAT